MHWLNTNGQYGIVAKSLHWLIALLILVQIVLGIRASGLGMGLERLMLLGYHKSIGMTILLLTLFRLAWRIYAPPPSIPLSIPRWQRISAYTTHYIFYLLLVTMPLVGWLSSSASNLSVSWFGIFVWPDLIDPNSRTAEVASLIHSSMASLLVLLLVLHIGAALRHHFVLRDGLLKRMLPGRFKIGQNP